MGPPTRNARSYALLGTAILAISSSAILVRWAEAPAIALAFWRTVGGAALLAPNALRSQRRVPDRRRTGPELDRRAMVATLGAGIALAVHFAAWLASLEMTSIAASVTLVSTVPIFVALIGWGGGGTRPAGRHWLVVGVTVVGAGIIAGGDLDADGDALVGDGLAIVGAAAMAVYLVLGARVRIAVGTAAYAARAYAWAAVALLPVAIVTETTLWGYDGRTWLVIVAMIMGPQLAGHTVLNLLLDRLGSLTVSLSLLAEPVGASVLSRLLLDENPPLGAWVGGPLVLGALLFHLRWSSRSEAQDTQA